MKQLVTKKILIHQMKCFVSDDFNEVKYGFQNFTHEIEYYLQTDALTQIQNCHFDHPK